MALTVKHDCCFINVTFDGVTDWNSTTTAASGLAKDYPSGIDIYDIQMVPSAAGDTLTVRAGSATGVILFKKKADSDCDNGKYTFHGGQFSKLFVNASEVSAGVMMILET
jgi:hypothetical protein